MIESDPITEAFNNILSEELENSGLPNTFNSELQTQYDRRVMVIRSQTNEHLPHENLVKIASRATLEISGLHRVVYDIATQNLG